MWYFVRWMMGTTEVDTGFACKVQAIRFALAKGGMMLTKEEYDELMSEELAEVC